MNSRHPYTNSCDLIRTVAGFNLHGSKLSRSDASRIRTVVADAIGINDHVLACALSDYYQRHKQEISWPYINEWIKDNATE